jgi:hypothetical protein
MSLAALRRVAQFSAQSQAIRANEESDASAVSREWPQQCADDIRCPIVAFDLDFASHHVALGPDAKFIRGDLYVVAVVGRPGPRSGLRHLHRSVNLNRLLQRGLARIGFELRPVARGAGELLPVLAGAHAPGAVVSISGSGDGHASLKNAPIKNR